VFHDVVADNEIELVVGKWIRENLKIVYDIDGSIGAYIDPDGSLSLVGATAYI
jgi:hypothetical protein